MLSKLFTLTSVNFLHLFLIHCYILEHKAISNMPRKVPVRFDNRRRRERNRLYMRERWQQVREKEKEREREKEREKEKVKAAQNRHDPTVVSALMDLSEVRLEAPVSNVSNNSVVQGADQPEENVYVYLRYVIPCTPMLPMGFSPVIFEIPNSSS